MPLGALVIRDHQHRHAYRCTLFNQITKVNKWCEWTSAGFSDRLLLGNASFDTSSPGGWDLCVVRARDTWVATNCYCPWTQARLWIAAWVKSTVERLLWGSNANRPLLAASGLIADVAVRLWNQPIDATVWWNRSAGVS